MALSYDHKVEHFADAISPNVKAQELLAINFTNRESKGGRLETARIIERMRSALGVSTNVALAEAVGVGSSALSNWIKRDVPAYDVIVDFATKNGLSLDWLVYGVGAMKQDAEQSPPTFRTAQAARISYFVKSWDDAKPADELAWLEQQIKRAVPEYAEWLSDQPTP